MTKKVTLRKGAEWIDRDLITSPFYIGLCQTETQFKRELKRLKIPESECSDWITADDKDATVWHLQELGGDKQCCLVCLRKKRDTKPAEIIGLLIHEAVHVWQSIRENIGEKEPSSEFEAYSIQSIAQRLIEAYKIK